MKEGIFFSPLADIGSLYRVSQSLQLANKIFETKRLSVKLVYR